MADFKDPESDPEIVEQIDAINANRPKIDCSFDGWTERPMWYTPMVAEPYQEEYADHRIQGFGLLNWIHRKRKREEDDQ